MYLIAIINKKNHEKRLQHVKKKSTLWCTKYCAVFKSTLYQVFQIEQISSNFHTKYSVKVLKIKRVLSLFQKLIILNKNKNLQQTQIKLKFLHKHQSTLSIPSIVRSEIGFNIS